MKIRPTRMVWGREPQIGTEWDMLYIPSASAFQRTRFWVRKEADALWSVRRADYRGADIVREGTIAHERCEACARALALRLGGEQAECALHGAARG